MYMGFQKPLCISYTSLLSDKSSRPSLPSASFYRLESPGEDAELAKGFLEQQGLKAPEHGELLNHKAFTNGFAALLEGLDTPDRIWMNPPKDVLAMTDKWETHKRLISAGVPRPPSRIAAASFKAWWEHATRKTQGRVFLKPRYGSSASGVCAVQWSGRELRLTAAIELGKDRLYNSLRIRQYRDPSQVQHILNTVLQQEMIEETWIPKATVDQRYFDIRIFVVARQSRHMVARRSESPLTNLHLGNERGSEEDVIRAVGQDAVTNARKIAEASAACFPEALYSGVDVVIDRRGSPWVLEVNAFGDLLPDIFFDGKNTYETELSELHHALRPSV